MNTAVALFALLACGVQWGWQHAPDGTIEYIIRVDAQSLDFLESGRDISSDLPWQSEPIRSFRITATNKPLPHEGEVPPMADNTVPVALPSQGDAQADANAEATSHGNSDGRRVTAYRPDLSFESESWLTLTLGLLVSSIALNAYLGMRAWRLHEGNRRFLGQMALVDDRYAHVTDSASDQRSEYFEGSALNRPSEAAELSHTPSGGPEVLTHRGDMEYRLKILMEEKKDRRAEVMECNKRFDRILVLYLGAVYGAIGLQTAGKIDLSSLSGDVRYVWLAFGFIFLNACLLLHGLAQSAWCMCISKFIHLKLDSELLRFAGDTEPKDGTQGKGLEDIAFLNFDDWETEVKDVANGTRGLVAFLWMALLVISSICSLTFVDVPRFLVKYGLLGYLPIGALCILHLVIFFQMVHLFSCLKKYHYLRVGVTRSTLFSDWCFTIILTAGFVAASYGAAVLHR